MTKADPGLRAIGRVEIHGDFESLSRLADVLSKAINKMDGDHEVALSLEWTSKPSHVLVLQEPTADRKKIGRTRP